jgi:hypothetical protein
VVVCLVTACTALLGADQTWTPSPGTTRAQLEPGPGEITVDKAVEVSREFFRKIGVDVPSSVIPTAERSKYGTRPGGSIDLDFAGEAIVSVDLGTGVLLTYDNMRRDGDYMDGKLHQGSSRLGDALAALNRAWSVFERVGGDKDCKLVELKAVLQSPGGAANARYYLVSAIFQPKPFGYRFRGGFKACGFNIDPLDGTVDSYENSGAMNPPYTIESQKAVLKLSEARAKADPLAEKYGVGQSRRPGMEARPTTKPSELMFVHPNGENGGLEYPDYENPARLRLAWVLYYPEDDEIWIDASDGTVLGGRSFKEDNLHSLRNKQKQP